MDERDIMRGIVDQAREAAVARGARKVAGLYLATSPAAGFTQDSIEEHFEMLTREDGALRGAALHIENGRVAATCLSCSDEFSTDAPQPVCPQCGSQMVRLDPETPPVQLVDVDIDDREEGGGA
jgi:Zn finger protein HypA/HybF involved in hydrogenase expression